MQASDSGSGTGLAPHRCSAPTGTPAPNSRHCAAEVPRPAPVHATAPPLRLARAARPAHPRPCARRWRRRRPTRQRHYGRARARGTCTPHAGPQWCTPSMTPVQRGIGQCDMSTTDLSAEQLPCHMYAMLASPKRNFLLPAKGFDCSDGALDGRG